MKKNVNHLITFVFFMIALLICVPVCANARIKSKASIVVNLHQTTKERGKKHRMPRAESEIVCMFEDGVIRLAFPSSINHITLSVEDNMGNTVVSGVIVNTNDTIEIPEYDESISYLIIVELPDGETLWGTTDN